MEIYVDELPKSCNECKLGYFYDCQYCFLRPDLAEKDEWCEKEKHCPLKKLSDQLAEERKKVVDLVMDNYNNYVGYEMNWIGFHEFLDKIKSGTDTNVDTKNN